MPAVVEKQSVLICDNESDVLDRMVFLANQVLPDSQVLCVKTPDALSEIRTPVDIAIVNILLEQENGIYIARRLLQTNPDCQIVFVSASPRYVSDAYDVPHLGLVMRDQLDDYLPRFLQRAAHVLRTRREQTLQVCVNRKMVPLRLKNIYYLERCGHTTHIFLCSGQEVRTRTKLTDLLDQPSGSLLCRCHVSYAVNISQVKQLQGNWCVMCSGQRIPISRFYMQTVKDSFFTFLSI